MSPHDRRNKSYLFCHPGSIHPQDGPDGGRKDPIPRKKLPAYLPHWRSLDLSTFVEAVQASRVIPGDLSIYGKLFEANDVYIRVIRDEPKCVKTYIEQQVFGRAHFYEFPSEAPSFYFFLFESTQVHKMALACSQCSTKWSCYLYARQKDRKGLEKLKRIRRDGIKTTVSLEPTGSNEGSEAGSETVGEVEVTREGIFKKLRRYWGWGTGWIRAKLSPEK